MTHAPVIDDTALVADRVTVGYGATTVLRDLSLTIGRGELVAIVGPNGCGKSTLLKSFARVNRPTSGRVLLEGSPITRMRGREVARRISLLAQSAIAPEGITVAELVARGRHPHHTVLRQWSPADDRAIAAALERTDLTDLADHRLSGLSGGQRQRAWVAMVLAQDTGIILLDEPTTFLDIAHQYDLLELLASLNREGRTIVTVLHDLNQAARFASTLVVMKDGVVQAQGAPEQVLTGELVQRVFGLGAQVLPDPQSGTPMVVPFVRR